MKSTEQCIRCGGRVEWYVTDLCNYCRSFLGQDYTPEALNLQESQVKQDEPERKAK